MKYSIFATKEDWANLYEHVSKFPELDLKIFKKSSSLDICQTAFYSFLRREKGISFAEASKQFPMFRYGNLIKATAN